MNHPAGKPTAALLREAMLREYSQAWERCAQDVMQRVRAAEPDLCAALGDAALEALLRKVMAREIPPPTLPGPRAVPDSQGGQDHG